jgi:hypothetical protein
VRAKRKNEERSSSPAWSRAPASGGGSRPAKSAPLPRRKETRVARRGGASVSGGEGEAKGAEK